jgi:uncharacterized protein (TIGR03437 family)
MKLRGTWANRAIRFALITLLFVYGAVHVSFAEGIIVTIAGKDFPFAGDGQPAVKVPLGSIPSIAVDAQGNVYSVVESFFVVKTGADGVLHVIAGNGIPAHTGDGGQATSASLSGPLAIALDPAGNLYVSEAFSHRIRKVTPSGVISTFAGTGQPDTSGDGGAALQAGLGQEIWSMVFDKAGNLYLAQRDEHLVRKIDTNGIITAVAGTGQPGFSGDGGAATKAKLTVPAGLAFDRNGNLLIGDTGNFRVRSVAPDGTISTVAGGGIFPNDNISASTAFIEPLGVAADAAGNIYLADYYTARIRRIDANGIITTMAGSGLRGFSGDGGPALAAAFAAPLSLALDKSGNIFVGDFAGSRIRKIDTGGVITTIAGNGLFYPSPDGVAGTETAVRFPWGVASAADGSVLVAERLGQKIRRIDAKGIASTVAGTGQAALANDGGSAALSPIALPYGVAADPSGTIYFSEEPDFKVRRVMSDGTLFTEAGNGIASLAATNGVLATNSSLGIPQGVALDAAGNVYFSDSGQNVVRRVSPAGIISTVAGNGMAGFSGDDGPALAASLNAPTGLAVDGGGNVYIGDRGNSRIRKVTPAGIITTIAGTGRATYAGEGGPARAASLSPDGIGVDAAGNLYVADPENNRILRITPAGTIGTFAGTGQPGSAGDGGPATAAAMNTPHGVAADAKGNIYIADTGNGRIRVVLAAPASFSISTAALSFTGKYTGAVTPQQSVAVTGSTAGLPFTVGVMTTDGSAWLQASIQNGSMPATVQINADPSELQPGDYNGVVTITAPGAQPSFETVSVSLTVTAADPPSLSVKTDPLSFSLTAGQGPASAAITVSNAGGGSIDVASTATTQSGAGWLAASLTRTTISPTSPASLTVTVDPGMLTPGTWLGQISITGSTGQAVVVPVTLVLSRATQKLLLTASGFTFRAVSGGGVVPPESFGIANTGSGVLNWAVTPGPSWLQVSSATGSSSGGGAIPQVTLSVNPATLTPGTYYDKVTVTSADADNAPQIVTAVLNVAPADQNPGPHIQPSGLLFTATAGGTSPGSQTVYVYNPGSTPLSFNSVRLTLDGNNWFVHLPATGVVTPQSPLPIVVQPDVTGLAPGVYSGVITMLFGDQSVGVVNLLLVVAPAPQAAAAKSGGAVAAATSSGCTPTKLALIPTSISGGFRSAVGWPTPNVAQIVDDCAVPVSSGSVSVTFNNGDPPLLMTPTSPGVWSATWTPRSSQAANITVTLKARSGAGLSGQTQITGQADANTGAPLLRPTAIVNAAYPAAPVPLAPGSLVSLFGLGLAPAPQTARGLPLPLEMQGTSVVMAGRELPLLYTADGQVNTLIPYDMDFNTRQQLVVEAGGKLTSPELVSIAPAQPVIFTADGSGTGQGLIYRTAGGGLADGANPAGVGEEILIEATGLGAVTPDSDSSNVPAMPFPQVANSVSLSVGGIAANVESAELSPDTPGVYYVRAIVPAGVAAGNAVAVAVVLSAAGGSSPVVSIAIR